MKESFVEIQQLGRLIRHLREVRGISASKMAQKTQLSASVISKFERGQTDIQLSTTVQLLGAMGMGINDLCEQGIFEGFLLIDWVKQAVEGINDEKILQSILDKVQALDYRLRHEVIFRRILRLQLGMTDNMTDVINYFEDLDLLVEFDWYLYQLAKSQLPEWLIKYLGTLREHPKVMEE